MKRESSYNREGYLKENYRFFHLRDTAGQELDFHYHEFDKIVMLLEGRVDYTVEDKHYELKPHSVLLVKHHTIHRAVIDKSLPYERVIIYLDGRYFQRMMPEAGFMNSFDRADREGRHLLYPDEAQKAELEKLLDSYARSAEDGRFGAEALRDTIIMQLLIQIGRLSAAEDESHQRRDGKVEQALSYINEHLSEELSVEAVAARVYLSKYHFMRLFKEQTGSTVHAYIRQKRLLQAARLIREGAAAGKAAADSGFSDYSAFHRAFKESFGISPGHLKK